MLAEIYKYLLFHCQLGQQLIEHTSFFEEHELIEKKNKLQNVKVRSRVQLNKFLEFNVRFGYSVRLVDH